MLTEEERGRAFYFKPEDDRDKVTTLVSVQVKSIYLASKYLEKTANYVGDIAILVIDKKSVPRSAMSVKLVGPGYELKTGRWNGTQVIVAGYGPTSYVQFVLGAGGLKEYNFSDFDLHAIDKYIHSISEKDLNFSFQGLAANAFGDSGGPVFLQDTTKHLIQVGVVSHGYPGLATSVEADLRYFKSAIECMKDRVQSGSGPISKEQSLCTEHRGGFRPVFSDTVK